jgi:hypothetical protein
MKVTYNAAAPSVFPMASSNAQPLPRYETPHLIDASASIASQPPTELEVFVPAQPIKTRTAKVRVTARTKAAPNPIAPDLEG